MAGRAPERGGMRAAAAGDRRRFRMIVPAYPAFNIYTRVARITTALGPVCVATAAARLPDWEVEIIDENNYRRPGPRDTARLPDHRTLQTIRRADAVGLYGGLSSTIPRLLELARLYRDDGVATLAGGQHFVGDHIREGLAQGLDYIVTGEGEETIGELLAALASGGDPGQIAGLAFLRDGAMVRTPDRAPIADFDRLPLPDFGLLRYARVKLFPIGWVRGCGMDCEFCTVRGRPRAASPERVLEQVASLLERHNARHFFLVDDLFGQFRADTLRLCRLLAEYQRAVGIRLDLTVQIRLDRARDVELLRAMREAGINTVAIGFESPIREELEAMNKRTDPEAMRAMTREFHRAGFLVHGMFIFGYPLPEGLTLRLSSRERVRRFRSFIRRTRLDTVQILLPVPLPGTAMTDRLAAQGRLFPTDVVGWEYYDGNFPLFRPDPPLQAVEMQACIRRIMGRFYRFRSMFSIGRNILIFPTMVFSLFNIRFGWRMWYRAWRNDLLRFGGWIVLRRWTSALRRGAFFTRLAEAERAAGGGPAAPSPPPELRGADSAVEPSRRAPEGVGTVPEPRPHGGETAVLD